MMPKAISNYNSYNQWIPVMNNRNQWMAGKFGLMVHYLPPMMEGRNGELVNEVNEAVESFSVKRFLTDFDRIGADYLLFTIGQNTGMYNAPNPVIDFYCGAGHTPQRNLVQEIADAVKQRNKHFLAYLPVELHCNFTLQEGFGWQAIESKKIAGNSRQELFQQRWCEMIRYWAEHLGKKLDGWWLDGCGWLDMDHAFWRNTLRAGNPDALVAFSYGDFCEGITIPRITEDDYFAGETLMLKDSLPRVGDREGFRPADAFVPGTDGMLWHALVPIDAYWWRGGRADWCQYDDKRFLASELLTFGKMEPPMYSDEELLTLFDAFPGQGGAVTLNAGIFLDGSLGEDTVNQLERIGRIFTAIRKENNRRF